MALEKILKTKLVERQPEGVALTAAAQAFCALADETQIQLDRLIAGLSDTSHQMQRDKQDENPASIRMRTRGWCLAGRA